MKNHKKILILFMFLFIYFVMPSNVLADKINVTSCTCSGNGASATLSFTKGNTPTISHVDWGGSIDKVYGAPSNNKNYYSDLNEGECPSVVLKKMTYTTASGNRDGSTVNKTRAKVYFYSPSHASDANSWTLSGCENQNQIFSIGQRSSMCKELVSVKMDCTLKEVKEHTDTSSANNTNDEEVENASGGDKTREPKKPNSPVGEQNPQTCEGVFGRADGSGGQNVAWILQKIFNYIRIFGIFLTIVLGAFDFTKSVISSDYDSLKKSQVRLVYRIMGIVALLLLPMLINFLLGLFISGSFTDFSCGIF